MTTGARKSGKKQPRITEQAIAALLTAPTLADAAKTCGVAESTLWRWMQEPAFDAALKAARAEVLRGAMVRLQGAMLESVDTLRRNLRCRRPSVEVHAAKSILELVIQHEQLERLAARIDSLEQRLSGRR